MRTAARLLPSAELIDRTLAIENAYTASRMRVLEGIPDNPVGIAFRTVGRSATAFMARHFANPHFNKVTGLRSGEAAEIEPLIGWYRDNGVKPRFEILPRDGDGELGKELARLGLAPLEFHTSLIRDATSATPDDDGVDVERVKDPEVMEAFLSAYIAGWQIPGGHDQFRRNVRAWLVQRGWSLFLAWVDGKPAAAAILYVDSGVGYLADACCDPLWRGRGLHTALLARRIRQCQERGVDFICSGAGFLSTSHRNMERAGMRIQFNRSIWTEPG
jgi:hypothetical protein